MMRTPRGERGIALVLVLWLVVVLGAVTAAVVNSTRTESRVVLNARTRTVARYAAESGIVAGESMLQRRLATAYGPARHQATALRGVAREFADMGEVPLGKALFGIQLINLSGRLDLNQADPEALVNLFSRFITSSSAQAIGDALQDWRDADDLVRPEGAEKKAYLQAGSPYVPRNASLTRLEELRRVRGVTESFALAVTPYITVDGDFRIDVNAAPELVLAAIPDIGAANARRIVSRRAGIGPFVSVSEVQALLGRRAAGSPAVQLQRLSVAPSRVLLVSRGWTPGHPLTHEIQAAYAIVGRHLQLVSWRERDL
jgi:general secretion pathway protein K